MTLRKVSGSRGSSAEDRIPCIGCGALVPGGDGPTHRYIGASPGCWALFGEVLAREYSDFRFARTHRLTVDAYAAQHPGEPSPRSIQSVAVHLVGLHVTFDQGYSPEEATRALQHAATGKRDFVWLEPPASLGAVTILEVHAAPDPIEHAERVHRWARSVWDAWSAHHATVRRWAAR